MIEIYHWEPNAHQAKPMIALYEKGVPFVSHYVDLLELEHVSPAYLKICATAMVPCVIEDGRLAHEALSLSEMTDYCELVDERFPGASLRPEGAQGRWRMRWWCAFMDHYFSPSLSILGWKNFMGPTVRQRHSPEKLERFLARIPDRETFRHWNTAIHDLFTDEQLAESRRRIEEGVKLLEVGLTRSPYLAGTTYSVADIVAFATLYAFPLGNPELANEENTPHFFDWLRRIHMRDAMVKTFQLSQMRFGDRVQEMRKQLGLA